MDHSHMKYINIHYNWIREVTEQLLKFVKIHTDENLVDMLMKVVTREKLGLCQGIAEMDVN